MSSTRPPLTIHRSVLSALAVTSLVAAMAVTTASPTPRDPVAAPLRGGPTTHVQELPLAEGHGDTFARPKRSDAGAPPKLYQVAHLRAPSTSAYSMIGVTWDDPGAGDDLVAQVRTHSGHGWTDWVDLEADHDGNPQGAEPDARGGTAPAWVGESRGVQVRVLAPRPGAPEGLQVDLIDPGSDATTKPVSTTTALSPMPRIITRREWGADESLSGGCWKPIHGPTVKGLVVHHTVNSNDYTKDQADNIVRGIYAYHTQSRGWCDIGYNFLIDRYGQIFEGRAGGILTPVRGAHAGVSAVNENTTGVATIGNFETGWPTTALKDALVRFAAWRLESYYRDSHAHTWIGGVRYPVIAGHRDVHSTACPGRHLYAWLPAMRDRVAARIANWRSANYNKWQSLATQGVAIGQPYVGERALDGGRVTQFNRGRIYWSSSTGAHLVRGAIAGRYLGMGATGSAFGFPTTDERLAAGGGTKSHFQHGRIYWKSGVGAHSIHGAILGSWLRVGGGGSWLGYPTTNERLAAGGGTKSHFQHGRIYWKSGVGAHSIHGAILGRWLHLGAGESFLGFPVTNEQAAAGGGTKSAFQHGRIYWKSGVGAYSIHGAILGRWLHLGGGGSWLGYPTSNEYGVAGGRRNDFEHGWIRWDAGTGTTTVHRGA